MFNLYQSLQKKQEEEKESSVIGHERFYQERSRSTVKKKRKIYRRANSAAEFSPATIAAAKRAAFRWRSVSQENKREDGKASPQKESLAKILFSRRSSTVQKHEYSALKTDGGSTETCKYEVQIRNGAFMTCKQYLANNERYELKTQLGDIGTRPDKHWFIVQDNTLTAERLLSLVPLPSDCPLNPSQQTRETLLELFRGLQHPYIHPVLDIEFWEAGAALVSPLNPSGSLRDVIYGANFSHDCQEKYADRGAGLALRTVQCLGRQILEALLFLQNRQFPPIYHLHTGNVIIQNGVARLAGLENLLFGLTPKPPVAPDTLAFGYILFEMSAGYPLATPPSPAHLELELERAPQVADALSLIFHKSRPATLEDLVRCDLFRGVELRELRGASILQFSTPQEVLELLDQVRNPVPPSPMRRKDVVIIVEDRRLEDILEEDNEDSDTSSGDSGR
ncbi:unnamed protein product [Brassicogethes aeneus]|uniref:Slowpoke-binding protein n=1 Tax=Brassicogethes aeneus TaxID=1431903 RepID=A0A9P0BJ14_BRAAE|nr:unnamed protein product [Brassicogethes aeneus]